MDWLVSPPTESPPASPPIQIPCISLPSFFPQTARESIPPSKNVASSPNRLSLGSRPHIDRVIINASPSPPRWLYIFPEKDAPPSMSLIEHLGENTIQMPHPSGQVPLGCLNHYMIMILHKTVRVRQLVGAEIFPRTCRKSCRKPVVKINASFPQGGKADCVSHLRSRAILPRPSLSGLSEAFGG